MSLFLNYESEVIDTTAKEASMPCSGSESMGHRLMHGFWQQHGQRTCMWLPTGAQTMETITAFDSNIEQRHQDGFR